MTGLTLIINGLDLSNKIASYSMRKFRETSEVLKSIGGTEYAFYGDAQTEVTVSFFPMTETEAAEVYAAASPGKFPMTYTDTYDGGIVETRNFRMMSDLEAVFLLMSVDGKRRYSGAPIQVRTSQ